MSRNKPYIARALGILVVVIALFTFSVILVAAESGASPAYQAQGQSAAPSGRANSIRRTSGAGQVVTAKYSSTMPQLSADQLQRLEANTEKANRTGPTMPKAAVPNNRPVGPGQKPPSGLAAAEENANAPAGPEAFRVFRNTVIPGSGVTGGGYGSISGRAHEPSTGANGKNVFQTGNWYASRSFNNGATWSYLDPNTIFGSDMGGFCCDQVTLYDSGRDVEYWLLQFGSGLKLATSRGGDLFTNWCYYNIDPTWFGLDAASSIDYNEMALGREDLYIASNLFLSSGGSGVGLLRFPIDSLTSCSGFNYNYITWLPPNWAFTWVPVQGADQGTMYWGGNWNYDLTNGSQFRVFAWDESQGGYSWFDFNVAAFNFMYRGSGQNCASPDNIVKNWCDYNDSRVKSGALAKGMLQFTFDASQDGGHPFPFGRRVYFRQSDMTYQGYDESWASWGAFQFWEIAPNTRGDIGMSIAWGGGTQSTDYYPSGGVLIQDDYAPFQPWQRSDVVFGAGNPCQSNDNGTLRYRWGDYLTVRAYDPERLIWIATNYAIEGNNCKSKGWFSEPHNILFGRKRDAASYNRWKGF